MSEPFPVNGQRVVLRRLVAADLPAFQQYRSDDELGRYQGWSPMSDADAAEFIARMGSAAAFEPGAWLQIAIAAPTGKLVGDIGLHLSADAGEAELGFTLERSAQGQGMATEAVRLAIDLLFEQTTAARIVGVTDARNDSSMRLLERVGMTRIRTQQAMFRGEPCVEHTYCIARPT